jgi:hypothetical protein
MRKLHISNSAGRNSIIVAAPTKSTDSTTQGVGGKPVNFKRYVAVADGRMNDDLVTTLGEDLSAALIEADPEIDTEKVGLFLENTSQILVDGEGNPLYASPVVMEITYDTSGAEVSRKEPTETPATVNDSVPLSWTGKKIPKKDAVRQFMFRRTMQLRHVDGVTFDFLYAIAKELHDADAMMLMGAGESGKDAIILQLNGSAYRGFLEGRIEGDSFKLLLHLSNMELKPPATKKDED